MPSAPRLFNRLGTHALRLQGSHRRIVRMAALTVLVFGGLMIGNSRPAAAQTPQMIQQLKVIAGNSSSISCGAGWSKLGTDLNKGAGGKYIYACVTYDASGEWERVYAVGGRTRDVGCSRSTDVKVDGTNNYGLDGNLNAGAGGQYIFFCLRRNTGGPVLDKISFIVISQSTPEWLAKSSAATACGLQLGAEIDLKDLNDRAGGAYIYTCNHVTR